MSGPALSVLPAPEPADAGARLEIMHRLDSSIFVEAGAGSGKTSALVSRIVRLVCSGLCDIGELAAITFTEEAAAELRTRVRHQLEAVAASAGDASERSLATEALVRIDEAAISTIHGFCRRLLAEYPLEAGLPPAFGILDEVGQSLAWHDAWAEALDTYSSDAGVRSLFGFAFNLGLTSRHLEDLAADAGREWDRCGSELPDVAAVAAKVVSAAEAARAAVVSKVGQALELARHCRDDDDLLLARLREIEPFVAELARSTSPHDILELLGKTQLSFRLKVGKKASWVCDVDEVRRLIAAAGDARDRLIAEVCDLVLPAMVATFDVLARRMAAERRAAGRLVFHDLLVLTRELLSTNADVLGRVRRTYRYLLVDEFQDTDPLQLEIIELIGASSDGRLFFVGDPKQSIYRFRGADLRAYEAARERFSSGARVSLASNFRSVPQILEFANACFGSLLPAYTELQAERLADDDVRVRVVGGALDASLRRVEQRLLESAACAAMIDRAVRTEAWLVADGTELRPARLSDVAILVPRRTGLVQIEAALDGRGLGYRVESASLIYRSQEVRDLLALCRAVDEPGNHVALLAALRSAAFGCGDDDLLAFRRAGGSWSIEGPPALSEAQPSGVGDPSVVVEALGVLRRYRELRHALGPIGLLEHAVADRRLMQMAAGSPRGRETWRRIRFLVERARVFVEDGGGGLGAFADWVDGQLAEGLRAVESVLPEPDEEVVHILTVHGAKGLEFPITVLAGFGTTDESRGSNSAHVLRSGDGLEVHVRGRLETSGYKALRGEEDLRDREEAVRLLYVAVTRARDHLVVCGHHVPAKDDGSQIPAGGPGIAPALPGFTDRSSLGQRLFEAAVRAGSSLPDLFETVDLDIAGWDGGGTPGPAGLSGAGTSAGPDGLSYTGPRPRPGRPGLGGIAQPFAGSLRRAAFGARRGRRWPGPEQGALFDIGGLGIEEGPTRLIEPGPVVAGVLGPTGAGSAAGGGGVGAEPLSLAEYEAFSERRHELLRRLARPRSVRATDLGSLASSELTGMTDVSEDHPFGLSGRGGTRLGRAVHATLQHVPVEASAGGRSASGQASPSLHGIAQAAARAEMISSRAGEVERLALAALESPTVAQAFASGSFRREVYVATSIGEVVLDGFVDLCFIDGGRLTIVDYKTDLLEGAAEVAVAGARYSLQTAAYALALGDVTRRPVARCVLVFLSSRGAIEFEVPDVESKIEQVRRLVLGAE